MKIESFSRRNLVRHLEILIDRIRGLEFLDVVEPQEVGLDPKTAHHYSPSGNKYLSRILRDLKIGPNDSIIDIGCGKGSAMRTMLKFRFSKVHGIELSPQLASQAVHNFNILKANNVEIFTENAIKFTKYNDYSVIYFYNPFPSIVMSPVMDSIIKSFQGSEKEIIIIYNNPICDTIITNHSDFSRICVYPDEWRNGIFVYSNRKFQESRMAQV